MCEQPVMVSVAMIMMIFIVQLYLIVSNQSSENIAKTQSNYGMAVTIFQHEMAAVVLSVFHICQGI